MARERKTLMNLRVESGPGKEFRLFLDETELRGVNSFEIKKNCGAMPYPAELVMKIYVNFPAMRENTETKAGEGTPTWKNGRSAKKNKMLPRFNLVNKISNFR